MPKKKQEDKSLCGKCKKIKKKDATKKTKPLEICKCGRPTTYNKKYCDEVDRYLKENIDEVDVVEKVKKKKKKVNFRYDWKATVRLPTLDGFAMYLGIARSTLFDWKDQHKEFSDALEEITVEQKKRLLNKGLSGSYNPTIAKLVLSANHDMREKSDVTSDGQSIVPTKEEENEAKKALSKM